MLVSALLREPFCLFETMSTRQRVADVEFDPPPVFIVGHWRSGTTFLHTLMSKDQRFCFPTILDALRPDAFFPSPFEKISRFFLLRSLPKTRPMDDVLLQAHVPQEDEMALASLGAPSLFNCFYFPRNMTDIFKREVLFDELPDERIENWRQALRFYLGKLCVLYPGRRLLIKNPAHSARIKYLRTLFPGAKFIHIHREPIDVVASTIKLYHSMLPLVALQDYEPAAIEAHVAWAYRETMGRLLASLAELPAKDKVEVRYEDLVRDPLALIEEVYRALELGDLDRSRQDMASFVSANARSSETPTRANDDSNLLDAFSTFRTLLGYDNAVVR